MKMYNVLKNSAGYLLRFHFFIAAIATLLAFETNIILQQPFQHWSLYAFIFTTTHFAYNVYYIKTAQGAGFAVFSVLSLLAAAALFFLIPANLYPRLFLIGLASCVYIFPVFFSIKKDNSFTVQKLFLLVFIWVATTWVLPAQSGSFQVTTIILLIYRIVFISISCLLFFIRDEQVAIVRRNAEIVNYIMVTLQFLLSISILLFVNPMLGITFIASSICCLFLIIRFSAKSHTTLHYLAFADGVLGAQAAFVLILYFIKAL